MPSPAPSPRLSAACAPAPGSARAPCSRPCCAQSRGSRRPHPGPRVARAALHRRPGAEPEERGCLWGGLGPREELGDLEPAPTPSTAPVVLPAEVGRWVPARRGQGSRQQCVTDSPTTPSPISGLWPRSCWSLGTPVHDPGDQEPGDRCGCRPSQRGCPPAPGCPPALGCPAAWRAQGSSSPLPTAVSVPAPRTSLSPRKGGDSRDGAGMACQTSAPRDSRSWIVDSTGRNGSIHRGQYGCL